MIVKGMGSSVPIVFLSGAGGGAPDFNVFRDSDDSTRFEVIAYPDWRRSMAADFSAKVLIEELAAKILAAVPDGPIRIVGLSIGGHLGYGIGIFLQEAGREIDGLCVIDSFMFASSGPSSGWKGRALAQGFALLREGRIGEFSVFLRSKFWRALVRFSGGQLASRLRTLNLSGRLSPDPIFESELSMRLLVQAVAPWLASIEGKPVALRAPVVLLRTELSAADDDAWRRRCQNLSVIKIKGKHHSLFEPENIGSLHEAFIAGTRNWRQSC
jgi:thioesterase domain-containing protein